MERNGASIPLRSYLSSKQYVHLGGDGSKGKNRKAEKIETGEEKKVK